KNLIFQIRSIEKMRGDGMKIPQSSEVAARQIIRKSITARRDMKKNEILTTDMISIKRPEGGIEPKYLDQIIGMKINTDIKRDSPIHWHEIY
ncbi:MAG TPA: SAF domain-containing protein, partial [Nitrosopumilaceae archaeon]|nr:SAF domain-containing protein [Nitrosopumilaceae archaeon]